MSAPEASGPEASVPASPARARELLAAELARSVRELGLARSGVEAPVTVALCAADGALEAILPVDPVLRADPGAVSDRAWLLAAATVGALVAAAGPTTLEAGAAGGHLLLRAPTRAPDAELAALAFEEHVAPVDRLRAHAVVVDAAACGEREEPRALPAASHPLAVAAAIAALDGRPADPVSADELEEQVLAAVAVGGPPRPHDDPDPALRVARRIAQRLDGMGKWGGYHTELTHLARGFAGNDRRLAEDVGEAMLRAGLLREKPSVGQRHVCLSSRRAGDIRALIDVGTTPSDLRLPPK